MLPPKLFGVDLVHIVLAVGCASVCIVEFRWHAQRNTERAVIQAKYLVVLVWRRRREREIRRRVPHVHKNCFAAVRALVALGVLDAELQGVDKQQLEIGKVLRHKYGHGVVHVRLFVVPVPVKVPVSVREHLGGLQDHLDAVLVGVKMREHLPI